jgi:DNA modification methylase
MILDKHTNCSAVSGLNGLDSSRSAHGGRTPTLAYPFDTTEDILNLAKKYQNEGKPQEVSFRKLVSWLKVGERATHYIHPYPAKLLPQIAHFFLASNLLVDEDDVVLDPFGGTGTVALESNLSGRNAFFADANPLARLIASVKTNDFDLEAVAIAVECLRKAYSRARRTIPPSVVNVDIWYDEQICRQLSRLHWSIANLPKTPVKELFWITFSCVARKLSNADPRLSVPVRLKESKWAQCPMPNAWDVFCVQLQANIQRILDAKRLMADYKTSSQCVGNDARKLMYPSSWDGYPQRQLGDSSVGLVITSPPYAGAQKYIRASSLSLGWLGLAESHQIKALENKNIGREHLPKAISNNLQITGIKAADDVLKLIHKKNPLRAAIAGVYINEMRSAITEMARVLKPGGFVVLVIGNNEVCGHTFQSSEYMSHLLAEAGLNPIMKLVDEIKSRGLMTKRNKTAGIISREWVLVYQK